MRTLNRPMFNMGGPIKQGIMHGIREPHASGGRAALVGNPVYPQTGGREHHFAAKVAQVAAPRVIPKVMPHIKRGLETFKNWFGKTGPVKRTVPKPGFTRGGERFGTYKGQPVAGNYSPITPTKGTKEITEQIFQPGGPLRYLAASPEGKAAKWIWDGKGWIAKAAKMPFKSPSAAIALTYVGGKWLWPDGTPANKDEIKEMKKSGGDKDYGPHTKGGPTTTAEQREKWAQEAKDKRINALLDTMGYDKARKNAAYDALIDAGKVVSERGTLDPKNITSELINPIVAATSQRFDKPEQIREAVGLMQTKADIQKEMNKEENALANEVKRMQLLTGEKALAGSTLKEAVLAQTLKQGSPTGATLATIARAKGVDAKVLPIKIPKNTDTVDHAIKVITESWTNPEVDRVEPGYYVVKDRIIIIDEEGNVSPLY
jgi:hypothetical protein